MLLDYLSHSINKQKDSYSFTFESVTGIGNDGVNRRDPSDIFKIGDYYYVYYSRNDDGVETSGYYSSTWLAKSTDTINWTEVGEAIPKGGAGDWDQQSTFTPNVFIKNSVIYVYYTSVDYPYSSSQLVRLGVAYQNITDIEVFPYIKNVSNPILNPSTTSTEFDSFRIDDTQAILQGNKIYLYYKGRQQGLSPSQTRTGLAICDASNPLGTYTKYAGNPIYNTGHEVMVFRYKHKLRSIITNQGFDVNLRECVLESDNGVSWSKVQDLDNYPYAGSYFREDNFNSQYVSRGLKWGLQTNLSEGIPYLEKFTVQ